MRMRFVALLAMSTMSATWAKDQAVAPVKTWEIVVPGEKEPDKLPLSGSITNNWDSPDKIRSGYLTTKEQLSDLWKALGQTDPVPDVDFKKHSVILIQLRAMRISIGDDENGKTVLLFMIRPSRTVGTQNPRLKTPPPKNPEYTLVTFPKEAVEAVVKPKKK
ncbi:MAG TPA: hypothetical protein VKD71_01505 [Gemmataceae bacterium]|nr:hypothetical protein [Gemmataceae bacterium]